MTILNYYIYLYYSGLWYNNTFGESTVTYTTETKDYSNYTLLQGIEKAANDIVNEIH